MNFNELEIPFTNNYIKVRIALPNLPYGRSRKIKHRCVTIRRKYYLLSNITIKNTNSPIDTCKNFIKKFAYLHEKTNINNSEISKFNKK